MRITYMLPVAALLLLSACSSPSAPGDNPAPALSSPSPRAAPADVALGSSAWTAWVSESLSIDTGNGLEPGSPAWAQAVQDQLGQEAPQSKPGSPQWQQSVDALLRTRLPASAASTR